MWVKPKKKKAVFGGFLGAKRLFEDGASVTLECTVPQAPCRVSYRAKDYTTFVS